VVGITVSRGYLAKLLLSAASLRSAATKEEACLRHAWLVRGHGDC